MFRHALGFVLISSFLVLAAPVPEPAISAKKGPPVEEMKKAIEDLGSKRFIVRDKAKKFLLEAGQAAEPLLIEAAKSTDEEISTTAKAILEKFEWGLYPDTPKALRDLIELFRTGTPDQRHQAISDMVKLDHVPLATLRKLVLKEENAELRELMYQRLYTEVRHAIPQLLRKGEYDTVEDMFDMTISASPGQTAHDYATFMFQRGKLDPAIKRFEAERAKPGEPGQKAAEVLVHLYRTKNDWPAALKAAEQSKKIELIERVLWQSADWKGLSTFAHKPDFGNIEGVAAAYDRLAGNKKEFDEKTAQIRKSAEDLMDSPDNKFLLRQDIDALLLNGQANDAIKILVDKKRELALTFDILCAQMKHKEAFDLVNEARRRDTDPFERNDIEIRRARMLYMLGEKDAATQLFEKLAGEVLGDDKEMGLIVSLVKAEARIGLRDKAYDHAATALEKMRKNGQEHLMRGVLEPLFGDDKESALMWWELFRKDAANEEAPVAMKRVRELLLGKLPRKELDEWIAKMLKAEPDGPPPVQEGFQPVRGPARFRHLDAVAAAYQAIKDTDKTQEFLRKAAEKYPTADRWIEHGDHLVKQKKYAEAADSYAKAAKQAARPSPDIEIRNDDFVWLGTEENQSALATYLESRARHLAGDTAEAKRLAEIAHWLPLGNEAIRAKLVEELNKRDFPELARREADLLMKTGWYAHYSFGNVLSFMARQATKEKDFALAADLYEKCVIGCLRTGANFIEPTAYLLVPESVRVYRARAMLGKGKIDEAVAEANRNLEVMPGNIDLAIKLVPELEKLGKKKEADLIYEKVRDEYVKLSKAYPGSAFAHNSAAWVMANCRRDLDAALKHAEKANEVEVKNAGYLDTLAEVHFRKGNRDKALTLMKECVELDGKNVYFRKQLERFKTLGFDSPTPDEGDDEE